MNSDQHHIIAQIKAGDEHAFEMVFRQYYARMCGYAVKYVPDPDEAEEIVQDVFFNYWNKKESLEITTSLEAYLFRSVRNACLNHLKHLRVRQEYVQAQEISLSEDKDKVPDKMVEIELQQKIDACIEALPTERKKIFQMSRFEGLKYREIAEQLSISVKTVEAQMGKALKFLRENLSDYLPIIFVIGGWII